MSGKATKSGKPTTRSQSYALARKNNNVTPPVGFVKKQFPGGSSKSVSEWMLHGPNVPVKSFPGMISRTENLTVKSTASGVYYTMKVRELFKDFSADTKVYGIVFRYCLDVSNGVYGLIKGFDVNAPVAPNPLQRRKFTAKQASGVQILAPTGITVGDIPDDLWFVIKYDNVFQPGVPVWFCTQYLQHSMPKRIEIQDSVQCADQDTALLDETDTKVSV
uniref:Coat protein n=1 Tax=Prune dwarf virus TaxID=33760 RepID=A0A0A7AAP2_9BROM|nr:coat protein [Prune dwarf virus]